MIPINITIDGQSVIDDLDSCTFQMDDTSYCWTINLSLKSKQFWTACDPNERVGIPRIKLIIGDTVYSFLCEERSTSREKEFSMSVWGRTKQALLSRPYSQAAYAVSDEYGSVFTWETSAVPASEVIQTIINEFCSYSITVNWNVEDFLVYPGSLTVENSEPIAIISQLAEAVGAILVPQIDGSLNVEYYEVLEGEIVADYDDSIEVLTASEQVPTRNGINAVVVTGASSSSSRQVWLSAEKKEETHTVTSCFDSFETDTTVYTYVSFNVRVYFYNSDPSAVLSKYFPYGSVLEGVTGIESITETVELVFGSGNTSKTNTDGETEVVGDPDVPLEYREVTYNVNYRDYTITATEEGDIGIIFYYSAENYVVYSFTATDACSWEDICDGVVLLPSCDYPDEEKYTTERGFISCSTRWVSKTKNKIVNQRWLVGADPWRYERENTLFSWTELERDESFLRSVINQLAGSEDFSNVGSDGSFYYNKKPIGADSPKELLVYGRPIYKREVEESLSSYDHWYLVEGASPILKSRNVYFINKRYSNVTDYSALESAQLEMWTCGLFYDVTVDSDCVYGRRKNRPTTITTPREKIVYARPNEIYYQYQKTELLYYVPSNWEELKPYVNQKWYVKPADIQMYSSYKDYSHIIRAMCDLQRSGLWCDLNYDQSWIYGRRLYPIPEESKGEKTLVGVTYETRVEWAVSEDSIESEFHKEWFGDDEWVETANFLYHTTDTTETTSVMTALATNPNLCDLSLDGDFIYGRPVISNETADYVPGEEIELRVFYDGTAISEKWCSKGSLSFVKSGVSEFTEEIEFLNGEASTEYPISAITSFNYHHNDENLFPDPAFTKGGKKVICGFLKGKLEYRLVGASITYQSAYSVFKVAIPSDWQGTSFSIGFCFDGCTDPKIITVSVGPKAPSASSGLRLLHNNQFIGLSKDYTINFVDGE